MTVRQIFYALTVMGAIEKTEAQYNGTVVRLLTEMRRDGVIPYHWVSDNTRWMRKPTTYRGLADLLQQTAKLYRRDLWGDADCYCEVWCEKDALAGVIMEETEVFDVPLMVSRGFSSDTYLQSAFSWAPEADRIGMPTGPVSGISVIDVDPVGMTWLGANWRRLPETRVHATPRGGRHLFFVHSPGLRCSTGKLTPGVDIKADGGCITIWGPGYEVLDGSPVAEFPKFVLRRLRTIERQAEKRRRELEERFRAEGGANEEYLVRFMSGRRNGERNAALFWAACRMGEAGGSGEALIAAALAVEARSTVRSGLQRGRQGHS